MRLRRGELVDLYAEDGRSVVMVGENVLVLSEIATEIVTSVPEDGATTLDDVTTAVVGVFGEPDPPDTAAGLTLHPETEVLYADDQVPHEAIRIDGEPLDPAPGLLLMLHKPVGHTCSTRDPGRIVFDLLPPRFRARNPQLSTVGRLDRDTSGLLLLTDDGALLHRIISPKKHVSKRYLATLARPLEGREGERFASGELMLDGEDKPLLPAKLEPISERQAWLTITDRDGTVSRWRRQAY